MLGAHLLFALTKQGKGVKAMKRTSSSTETAERVFAAYDDNWQDAYKLVEWVDGDMSDPEELAGLMKGARQVYHSAAMVSFSERDSKRMIRGNIEGTANIVNACLENRVEKLCHVSSVSALGGMLNGEPVTEESKWSPNGRTGAYAISKFNSELEVWRGIAEGLNAVIVNPTVIIGPGNWNQGSSSMIKVAHEGLKYYTSGGTGFVDARDVVNCMIALMESPVTGERFIINAENVSYQEFFTTAAEFLGVPPPQKMATPFMMEIAWRADWLKSKLTLSKHQLTKRTARSGSKTTHYSNEKIRKALDYVFIPVKEATRKSCEVFLETRGDSV